MSKIFFDVRNNTLKINSYNGSSAKKELFRLNSTIKKSSFNKKWNFFRQGDNNSYVKGNISYEGDCRNNLIISPYQENNLADVRDAFVFIRDLYIEVSPISDILNAIDKGKKALSSQEVHYNIPKVVFERENLVEKNVKKLKEKVEKEYGIKSNEISLINYGKARNSIYHIKGNDKEYVLKFRGRNKERAEALSKITENIPNYFPINFHKKDKFSFTFMINGEVYGLEEFVRGISSISRNLEYFSLLGTHIGLLHNKFSEVVSKNTEFIRLFDSKIEYTNESNLISFYLDLLNDKQKYNPLLSELENIIKLELNKKMRSLNREFIHGDLNYSNLIWQKDNPKIIDSETIKNSIRLSEFESPLIFCGNMEKPQYVKNSLGFLVNAYNQSSNVPLSTEERAILPFLLKYALLRNFVVRKIRRISKDESYLDKIIENLRLIDEDLL